MSGRQTIAMIVGLILKAGFVVRGSATTNEPSFCADCRRWLAVSGGA